MAERTIELTTAQLHNIVGSYHELGKNVPLELATSTLHHAAEELRVMSCALRSDQENSAHDASNTLFAVAQRLECMAVLCDELGKKSGAQ